MKLFFSNMIVTLIFFFNVVKQPDDYDDLAEVNMIDDLISESFVHDGSSDPLEVCLTRSGSCFDKDNVVHKVNALLDSIPMMNSLN